MFATGKKIVLVSLLMIPAVSVFAYVVSYNPATELIEGCPVTDGVYVIYDLDNPSDTGFGNNGCEEDSQLKVFYIFPERNIPGANYRLFVGLQTSEPPLTDCEGSLTMADCLASGAVEAQADFTLAGGSVITPILTLPVDSFASLTGVSSQTITDLWPILVIFISAPFGFWIIEKTKKVVPAEEKADKRRGKALREYNQKRGGRIGSEDFYK